MRRVEVGLSVKENKPDYITTFLTFVLVGMKSHEGGHVIGLARVLFADAFLRDEAVDELARSHVESGVPDLLKHMFMLSHSSRNVSLDESTYASPDRSNCASSARNSKFGVYREYKRVHPPHAANSAVGAS